MICLSVAKTVRVERVIVVGTKIVSGGSSGSMTDGNPYPKRLKKI